jgi:hypothetical protein
MSAAEQLLEQVKLLDEEQAGKVLNYLAALPPKRVSPPAPRRSVRDAVGWCLKYNHPLKTTEEWTAVLRG